MTFAEGGARFGKRLKANGELSLLRPARVKADRALTPCAQAAIDTPQAGHG
ncbi:hypothetical protein [uncultured Aquitalea sp.]|uniref:hypothetical protein n=1 Tax=uncultured Aquitalea sp. TaxID=540272 RepID=UPI0025F1C7A2|nr:hypothetical protein [uncultured Aquitalea sp.]